MTPRALCTENIPGIPSEMRRLCPPYSAVNSTPEAESAMSSARRPALPLSPKVRTGQRQRSSMNCAQPSSRFMAAAEHMSNSSALASA